jgi:hypothetical protein
MAYNFKLVDRLLAAAPAISVETADRIEAIHCILTADLRAIGMAWETLSQEYKGMPPTRLDAWADAIDAAYLYGF